MVCEAIELLERATGAWVMRADAFRYDGKRALVVGGATGMGAAVAELVQDLAPRSW